MTKRTPPRGHVRIRSNVKRTGYFATIPKPIGDLVGTERLFRVEVVDEGVLLRYVEGGEPLPPLPAWLTD